MILRLYKDTGSHQITVDLTGVSGPDWRRIAARYDDRELIKVEITGQAVFLTWRNDGQV